MAQSGERGPSVEEGRWTVWGRKLTFDLPDGSPWPSAAGRSAALQVGGHQERAPGWDLGNSGSLQVCEGVGMMAPAGVAGSGEIQQWGWWPKRRELMVRSKGSWGTSSPCSSGVMLHWGSAERVSSHSPEEEGWTGR